MAAAIPKMNLSPDATPWGKWAQARITDQDAQIAQLRKDLDNATKTINAIIRKLPAVV